MPDVIDFRIGGGGSVYLLTPVSERAKEWVKEHIPSDAQTFGGAVAVEWRYISDIVDGIKGDGLGVA